MYKVTIGLEVHCELKTISKNFSSAPNDYTDQPNINVSAIDLGLPGIMPKINKNACQKALKIAIALNCQLPDEIVFDRKNYFYPDLPKGYQITQIKKPMGINGELKFLVNEQEKTVKIHQIHLEEDTASLEHFSNYSLIDYNRSGIPLIEIVTKPCIYSAEEAITFLEALRDLILYCEVSEARTDRGQMRCDVNVSVSKDETLGTKVEIKNLNSFTNVKAAIEYEIKRQSELLDQGEKIIQETRRIGSDLKTYGMRDKVDAVDYKYFTEPNLPPIALTEQFIAEIKKDMPVLQYERILKYTNEYQLSTYDAVVLSKQKEIADYFEESINYFKQPQVLAKWVSTVVLGSLNKLEISLNEYFITPKMLAYVAQLVTENKLSELHGKKIIYEANAKKIDPKEIIEKENMQQITDKEQLTKYIEEAIDENPKQVAEYLSGKDFVANYFVGQVMQKTNRQADPKKSLELIKQALERRKK